MSDCGEEVRATLWQLLIPPYTNEFVVVEDAAEEHSSVECSRNATDVGPWNTYITLWLLLFTVY